jgi:haloalkane dehalogenase
VRKFADQRVGFPNSRGIRRAEGARLFWPEEFPDTLAEEAHRPWDV